MPILDAVPIDYFTWRFLLAIVAFAFGAGFQHGYHTGASITTQEVVKVWIIKLQLDRTGEIPTNFWATCVWSTMVAMMHLGAAIGAALTALVAKKLGRRGGLMMNKIFFYFAIFLMTCARLLRSFEILILGRFLVGVHIGLGAGLAPMYLVEIAPDYARGAVASSYYFFKAFGLFLATFVGMNTNLGTESNWPYVFAVPILADIIQTICLIFCPESPKHLMITKQDSFAADRALIILRAHEDIDDEFDLLEKERELQGTKLSLIKSPQLRYPLIICLIVVIGKSFAAVIVIYYYLYYFMGSFDMGACQRTYTAISATLVNLCIAFFVVLLMDLAGRRILVIVSFIGVSITWLVVTAILLFVGSIKGYTTLGPAFLFLVIIMFYAFGAGPYGWFCVPELFPHNYRPLGASIVLTIGFLLDYLISQTYLIIFQYITFFICFVIVGITFVAFLLSLLYVPETKQETAEFIIRYFEPTPPASNI